MTEPPARAVLGSGLSLLTGGARFRLGRTMASRIRVREEMRTRSRKKAARDLTFLVLQVVADYFEAFEAARDYPGAFSRQGLEGVRRLKAGKRARAVRRRAYQLRRRGFLEARKVGTRLRYSLTGRGEAELLKRRMKYAPVRSDGKTILVTFDIPEHGKRAREALRHFLRASGFRMLQWSVWATEKDVDKALRSWIRSRGLGSWVRIFVVEK